MLVLDNYMVSRNGSLPHALKSFDGFAFKLPRRLPQLPHDHPPKGFTANMASFSVD